MTNVGLERREKLAVEVEPAVVGVSDRSQH